MRTKTAVELLVLDRERFRELVDNSEATAGDNRQLRPGWMGNWQNCSAAN